MALIKKYKSNNETDYEQAYFKVNFFTYYTNSICDIWLDVFESKENRDNGDNPIETIKFKCDDDFNNYFNIDVLNNNNPIKQSYEYLKSLNYFINAMDDN